MTLCQSCRNINLINLDRGTHPTTYRRSQFPLSSFAVLQPSAQALIDSARDGCPLCAKFWDRLSWQGERTKELLKAVADGRWPNQEEGEENPRVIFSCQYTKDESDWLFNGEAHVSCGKWGNNFNPSQPISEPLKELFGRSDSPKLQPGVMEKEVEKWDDSHTGSSVNMELAKVWLQDCLQNHEECTKSQPRKLPSELPSRVIDVLDQARPYVLEVEDHLDHDDYLTLSYCWGQGYRLICTAQAKESFQQSLPVDDRMPLTFREAFQVTRAFGYRYIWIDALCIVQDDVLDLQKEMTKMGAIYKNSAVTIFAGNGPSVQAGLFAHRNGPGYKPSSVSMRMEQRDRDVIEHGEVSFVSVPYKYESPLSMRAWILQEQVLAQRQLVFTPRQITWTCKSKSLTESCPLRHESTEANGLKKNIEKPVLAPIRSLVATMNTATSRIGASAASKYHFWAWYRTVETYNARNLTVASDKLPAISAIARLIQTHRGCEYGAGLFKEDLSVGLCWTTNRAAADADDSDSSSDESSQEAKHGYVAPSWSWASLRNTALIWKGHHSKDLIPEEGVEVLDWKFTYVPGAMIPFGQLTSGALTVRGRLRQCLLIPHFGEEKWDRTQRLIWGAWAVDPSTASILDLVALDTPRLYCDLKKRFEGLDFTTEAFYAAPNEYLCRALPVSCLVTCVEKYSNYRAVCSLVLVHDGMVSNEYRRIGLVMESSTSSERWDETIAIIPRSTVTVV